MGVLQKGGEGPALRQGLRAKPYLFQVEPSLTIQESCFHPRALLSKEQSRSSLQGGCKFSGILLCRQSGNHPYENLAKSGDKPDMKF